MRKHPARTVHETIESEQKLVTPGMRACEEQTGYKQKIDEALKHVHSYQLSSSSEAREDPLMLGDDALGFIRLHVSRVVTELEGPAE